MRLCDFKPAYNISLDDVGIKPGRSEIANLGRSSRVDGGYICSGIHLQNVEYFTCRSREVSGLRAGSLGQQRVDWTVALLGN
jgi:hypothetical protein